VSRMAFGYTARGSTNWFLDTSGRVEPWYLGYPSVAGLGHKSCDLLGSGTGVPESKWLASSGQPKVTQAESSVLKKDLFDAEEEGCVGSVGVKPTDTGRQKNGKCGEQMDDVLRPTR